MDSSIQTLKLQLIKRNDRPSFEYDGVLYLFDTGANMPVWCSGAELFKDVFKDAIETKYEAHITGFGEGYTSAKVYNIPEFVLGDEDTTYKIVNLHVAVTDYDRIKFDFILSSTMFSKADYKVSNKEHFLEIQFSDREYRCTPITKGDIFDKVSIWTQ